MRPGESGPRGQQIGKCALELRAAAQHPEVGKARTDHLQTHRAAVAERAARAGGVVARETFRGEIAVETKTDETDVVTVADRDAQQQAVATVRQEFPEDPFLCEEEVAVIGGVDRRDSVPTTGPVWVVDPIDGTANYVRGLRYWATVVAALSRRGALASIPSAKAISLITRRRARSSIFFSPYESSLSTAIT